MGIRAKIWGTASQVTREDVIELTTQFYVTLRSYFAEIKKAGAAEKSRNKDAFERVQVLLEGRDGEPPDQNWTSAYEVEQLLVHLFDDDTVTTEVAVRVLEAKSVLQQELATMYTTTLQGIETSAAASNSMAAVRRRSLLARLVNDLQWRYIVNEARRRYSKLITRRTAVLSVVALTIFVGFVVIVASQWITYRYGDLRLLWIAGLSGTWGATFSMLATLKSRLDQSTFDDLKLMKAISLLLSRVAIGAGAASILFFFLLSGLLGGTAFPTLVGAQASATDGLPAKELALLIVWCFIAGFSEQLIPGLLASTEARAGAAASNSTDRFRPTTEAASRETVQRDTRTAQPGIPPSRVTTSAEHKDRLAET